MLNSLILCPLTLLDGDADHLPEEIMANKSIKTRNKQLKRRLDGLKSKCYQYGKLENIELALVIHNIAKSEHYAYKSRKSFLPHLERVSQSFPGSDILHLTIFGTATTLQSRAT